MLSKRELIRITTFFVLFNFLPLLFITSVWLGTLCSFPIKPVLSSSGFVLIQIIVSMLSIIIIGFNLEAAFTRHKKGS